MCKLEKNHLHALPPSAAPHWLTGWKAVFPLVVRSSSPSAASVRTQPTFSRRHPRYVASDWIPRRCPSWTARPPIGCWCSSPLAIGCAPGPDPRLPLSARRGRELERAPRSRTCGEWEEPGAGLLRGRRRDGTTGGGTTGGSGNESSPYHCCRLVIWRRRHTNNKSSLSRQMDESKHCFLFFCWYLKCLRC